MSNSYKVIVTGEHEELSQLRDLVCGGERVEIEELRVLSFEKLPIPKEVAERIASNPYQWVVFTSPRAIEFFDVELPIESQVACVGETTAMKASESGYNPDFFPTEAGSEKFLEEFADMVSNTQSKPNVLIIQAEKGRVKIQEGLKKLGCQVETLNVYRTHPLKELAANYTQEKVDDSSFILFTSPSSFEAFRGAFQLPKHGKFGAMGSFTFEHLAKQGVQSKVLPEGKFERLGEIVC